MTPFQIAHWGGTKPRIKIKDATFCVWRTWDDTEWCTGSIAYPDSDDPDGSADLLRLLDGNPATYQHYADEYFEVDADLKIIEAIYQHVPLNTQMVKSLNPTLTLNDLTEDLTEIGYPFPQ